MIAFSVWTSSRARSGTEACSGRACRGRSRSLVDVFDAPPSRLQPRATEWAPPATSPRKGKRAWSALRMEGLQRSVQAEGEHVRGGAGSLLK